MIHIKVRETDVFDHQATNWAFAHNTLSPEAKQQLIDASDRNAMVEITLEYWDGLSFRCKGSVTKIAPDIEIELIGAEELIGS